MFGPNSQNYTNVNYGFLSEKGSTVFRGIQNYSILIGSLPYNNSLIVRFGLGQFLFGNNSAQLIVNCTHNHPVTATNFT